MEPSSSSSAWPSPETSSIQRMFTLYVNDNIPVYLDKAAVDLLLEARSQFERIGFGQTSIVETGEDIPGSRPIKGPSAI